MRLTKSFDLFVVLNGTKSFDFGMFLSIAVVVDAVDLAIRGVEQHFAHSGREMMDVVFVASSKECTGIETGLSSFFAGLIHNYR